MLFSNVSSRIKINKNVGILPVMTITGEIISTCICNPSLSYEQCGKILNLIM